MEPFVPGALETADGGDGAGEVGVAREHEDGGVFAGVGGVGGCGVGGGVERVGGVAGFAGGGEGRVEGVGGTRDGEGVRVEVDLEEGEGRKDEEGADVPGEETAEAAVAEIWGGCHGDGAGID